MSRPKSKNKAVCQNKDCLYYQKELGKDIIKKGRNYAKHQRFLCRQCQVIFVETKGTPLYRRRLDEKKIKKLCEELMETKGVRAIARTMHIHRDTVGSYLSAFAEHATELSQYLTKNVGLSEHELDEFWTFVKKNKRKLSPVARKKLQLVTSGVSLPSRGNLFSSLLFL